MRVSRGGRESDRRTTCRRGPVVGAEMMRSHTHDKTENPRPTSPLRLRGIAVEG